MVSMVKIIAKNKQTTTKKNTEKSSPMTFFSPGSLDKSDILF